MHFDEKISKSGKSIVFLPKQGNRYLYFATGYPVCAADSIDAAPVGPYRRACQPAWRGSADGADLPPFTFNSIFKICSMQKAAILQR